MPPDKADAIAVTRRLINPGRVDWLDDLGIDLVVGRRDGFTLHDLDGKQYIDALCDGSTFNLGHRNPELVATLKSLLDDVDIGCQFLVSNSRARLAELLVANSPGSLTHVHFVPSGSEATDAAIKCAMAATGRRSIVGIDGAFHGVTGLAARATGGAVATAFGIEEDAEHWRKVPWNDIDAMAAALAKGDVAAVILETVPATLGWPLPDDNYLAAVRELCARHGTLLIIDEIQTGLGRSGQLWAIDHWGVDPDIMIVAKGAGGGLYPLAYVLMSDQAAEWTKRNPLAMPSTFGGSEIGCALGATVLDIVRDPVFLEQVRQRGEHLGRTLAALEEGFPGVIRESRRLGMAAAIQFHEPRAGIHMMSALFRHGVLAIAAASDTSVIQLKPPLIIDEPGLDMLGEALERSIHDCCEGRFLRAAQPQAGAALDGLIG